jgi:aarF domain-containing kinase
MSASGPPPRGIWSRSTKLARLAAGLAQKQLSAKIVRAVERGEEVAQKLNAVRLQVEQAKQVVEQLGQLKGAAMKAGQLLSIELRDVFPAEVTDVLSRLQDSGAPVRFEEIDSVLRQELGPERRSRLQVEETAVASASIGQVHRARLKNADGTSQTVALKVQFRGIADTIDSDLSLLERIAKLFLAVQLKNIDLTSTFEELKAVLKRETDYAHEAQRLLEYRHHTQTLDAFQVPQCFAEFSTARVLAMSFEEGLKLDEYMKTNPPKEERLFFATALLDLYFREFFEWGLVQTDANFANFLFRPAAKELVLLDFGATRSYSSEFRCDYQRLLLASFRQDRAEALQYALKLGLIDAREGPLAQQALHELLEAVLSLFRDETQPYDFTSRDHADQAAVKLKAFYRALTCSAAPAQLIFLHRKLGGIHSMGKALGVKLDLRPFWKRLTALPNEHSARFSKTV